MSKADNNFQRQYMLAHMDELQWMQFRRKELASQISECRNRIKLAYESLTEQERVPDDAWGKAAYWLSRGSTILNGLRVGFKVGTTINTLLKLKRLFIRRKTS